MAASLSYAPEAFEQAYYLGLFQAADVKKTGNIGGAEAVQFFARSKLPIEILKNIWTVADQPSTSSLDHKKFAVAIRLIQLTQNGTKGTGPTLAAPPGVNLKPVMFEGVSGASVPLPQAPGSGPPPPTPQRPQRVAQVPSKSPQQQQQQQQPPPTPSRALVSMDPYSMTPQERSRYEGLFPQYAKTEENGQQFVYGSEAVPLFMKSGVDPNILRDIWNMVDRNPVDNRLDKLEFAMAMHLIVCISKKNLPLPPGGSLPNSLQALKVVTKVEAPKSPMRAPPVAQSMPPPAEPQTSMTGPPPLGGPGSGALGGMSISDAFEGLSTEEPALPSYVPEAAPPSAVEPQPYASQPTTIPPAASYDVPEVAAPTPIPQAPTPAPVVEEPPIVREAPAVVPAPTYTVSNSQHEELEKLKAMLQKLQAENVSLKAQLGNMTEEEKEVQQELGQTIAEITSLSAELGAQRQQVLDAKNRLLETKAELKAQKDTKGVLTELISEAQETKAAIESATETLESVAVAPAPAVETADLFGMEAPVSAPAMEPQTVAAPEGFQNEHSVSAGVAYPPATNDFTAVAPVAAPEAQQAPPPQNAYYNNYTAAPVQNSAPPSPAVAPVAAPEAQQAPPPQNAYYNNYTAAPVQNTAPPPPSHNRQGSGFDMGSLMGGSAAENDNFSVAAHSHASTGEYGYDDQAFEIVEEMKKKAQRADGAARDAEAASRKLAADAEELRADSDRAEANYRSLVAAADEKKKGRFGGGKKKKMLEEAEQAGKDSAEIKKHFMAIQSQALEAATLAAQTRSEADRLRDEAEAAELQMASAASRKQAQPAPTPAAAAPATNGYGVVSSKPAYGTVPPQQQQHLSPVPQYGQMPLPAGGYNGYMNGAPSDAAYGNPFGQGPPQMSLPDPSRGAPGVMGNSGGYEMPSPAAFQAPGTDPYANPF